MTPSRRRFMQTAAGAAAIGITTSARSFGNTRVLEVTANFPAPPGPDRLPPEWYQRKIKQVQAKMAERNLDALVLLNAHNVVYTTGYFHLPTERPLAVLIPAKGEPALFVPGLESDQVKLWWIKDVEVYFDYPGPRESCAVDLRANQCTRTGWGHNWNRGVHAFSACAHPGGSTQG